MSNKNKQQINPEIEREKEEKLKSQSLYDDTDDLNISLFPCNFMGGTASATECTGLMQTIPSSAAALEAYEALYSYRQAHPAGNEEKNDNA